MDELQQAMNMAKISLMQRADSSFFTTICFSLKHIWDSEIPTACTNGTEIRFNPDFFMELNREERIFLLLHESMHVAYLHMDRLQDREPKKWNYAADHVINLQLIERGFRMPKDGLADRQYIGLSTEEVYNLIPENKKLDVPMMDLMPPEKTGELAKAVEDILVRASIQSKMDGDKDGTIPGDIEIFLNKLLKPKLPWNRILQKYLHSMSKADYTFRKPNRRFFPTYHLPSLFSESLCNIAVAVDSSGSVTDEDFLVFVTEVNSILKMMKPEKISLIQFDTQLQSVEEVHSVQELMRVRFHGRGGTNVTPVLDWVDVNKPHLLLVFTDGYFRFYREKTKEPIIWLIHNNKNFNAPFGKTIHYEI